VLHFIFEVAVYASRLAHQPARLDEALSEGRIREVLEPVWPLPQRNKPALLHGDFWPGNTLWKHGRLLAIIDWEDAALGDPLADVANARLEVLWAFGLEAMNGFTGCYKTLMPALDFGDLPYWDLGAALRPARAGDWLRTRCEPSEGDTKPLSSKRSRASTLERLKFSSDV
jgi:aminoglycoside phosphotransferase (APT) family kinase protein